MSTVDWDALRLLRMSGRKPKLPVIVTTDAKLPQRFHGVGCMTILHESGTKFPVKLLAGLKVLAFFDSCSDAIAVQRLFDVHDCWPTSFSVWCVCGSCMTVTPRTCAKQSVVEDWGLAS